jgi:hypothetical protein
MATGDAGANHIPIKTASCRSRRVTVCRGVAKHRREAAHIWCGATQRMCPGQRKEGQIYSPPFGRASKHKENTRQNRSAMNQSHTRGRHIRLSFRPVTPPDSCAPLLASAAVLTRGKDRCIHWKGRPTWAAGRPPVGHTSPPARALVRCRLRASYCRLSRCPLGCGVALASPVICRPRLVKLGKTNRHLCLRGQDDTLEGPGRQAQRHQT